MIEEWRPVVGYEALYSVSCLGRVRSEPRIAKHCSGAPSRRPGKLLKLLPDSRSYFQVGLSRDGKVKICKVAHLVAAAFIGPRPSGLEVCHGDGDSANNSTSNLRYDTPKSNAADRRRHGTHQQGERGSAAKLTQREALEVLTAPGKQKDVAKRFGITQPQVSMIRAGARWSHLKGQPA